jgi:hypothetical protein
VVYNVELYRAAGRPRRPADLQGGVIPANSVQVIELETYVAREEAVAAAITTVRGRMVAERLQILDGELGPAGAALQLGVTAPANSWMLSAGRIHEGGDDRVIVFNPSAEETANVNIELWPINPTDRSLYGLGAIPRELLPGRFEIIDLRTEADRFGLRLPYELGVSATSANGVPIVAERWQFATQIDTSLIGAGGTEVADAEEPETDGEAVDGEGEGETDGDVVVDEEVGEEEDADATGGDGEGDAAVVGDAGVDPDGETPVGELDIPGIFGGEAQELLQPTATFGIATSRGTEVLSNRWVIPWLPTPTADSSVVTVTSPSEAAVEVFVMVNGALQGPSRATIAPGGRAIIPVTAEAIGAPVVVVSDAPVSVEAQVVVVGEQLSAVPGIPTVR